MSRKRSLKQRYLGFLRRIWPAPTLAMMILPFDAYAARAVGGAVSAGVDATPAAAAEPASGADDELRYDWDPRLLPTELQLAPELRSACAPVVSLPPSLTLDGKEEVIDALEPIASCLTLGPLPGGPLHLLGRGELAGQPVLSPRFGSYRLAL